MADNASSHLEKMGRELKCPICLSLFDSAVSLTCNHVFCKTCVHKSMKSRSSCPVCKVPYQRREIRPAPHMDNLVNIYKSMEVASGLTLFVTQDQSTAKSGAHRQTQGDLFSGNEDISGKTSHMPEHLRKEAADSEISRSKTKLSSQNRGQSSFQLNKRVQVPQSPSTDTPLRETKLELGKSKTINNAVNKSPVPSGECLLSKGKESTNFAPFFWLQEDDTQKSSQHTDGDHLTFTPAKVPSFSDIKDSDDDVPSKLSPKGPVTKCDNAELFDSEMFEWTQRPCSPELCSTPLKMQSEKRVASNTLSENELEASSDSDVSCKEATTEWLDDVDPHDMNCVRNNELRSNSCAGSKTDDSQNGCERPQKRARKKSKRSENIHQKNVVDISGETHHCLKFFSDLEQGQGSVKTFALGGPEPEIASNTRSCGLPDTKLADNVNDQDVSKSLNPLERKAGINVDNTLKRSKRFKSSKKGHRNLPVERIKQMEKVAKVDVNNDVIISNNTKIAVTSAKSNSIDYLFIEKPSRMWGTPNHPYERHQEEVPSRTEETIVQERVVDGNEVVPTEVATQAQFKINEAFSKNHLGDSLKRIKMHDKKEMPTLRKCNASSTECAFCHSTEETEASGEMVHYARGKPVPATYSGNPVIHSHRNCTEWAPNVYFEEDTAVNLEEELVRSRKIKCSLCGKKGAALGCFEKSCRKSFHVPCAKMLRECRWDTNHFVILCSVHASLKLPSEMSISKVSLVKKGKHNLISKLQHQQPCTSIEPLSTKQWSCGRSSEKIMICSSALTQDEKESLSEFVKSSGAVVSALWNRSVTHVIASINENGACKRTLKFLMGILEGKWILSIKWVQACLKAKRLVEETPYEISCDTYGIRSGPYLGRLRVLNKQPKLFAGFEFYFNGDFESSYKRYLQDLVTAAGGTILHRKPIAEYSTTSALHKAVSPTIIVYSTEQPDNCDISKKVSILDHRRLNAEALASSSEARVASNTWVLNSIAAHKLQNM